MKEKENMKENKIVKGSPKKGDNKVKKSAVNKKVKEKNNKLTKNKINDIEMEENIKKINNRLVFIVILVILTLIFLFFLSNKTFFRNKYSNGKFTINIPIFTYFISDDGNTIIFKTLRKSEYTRSYYDEYLSNLDNYDFYTCSNGKTLYYNSDTKIAIYNIDITKKFALKTIKVNYSIIPDSDRVCR